MREIIANAVASDPEEYSEAFLGQPNPEYCKWILKPESWGGAIELSILSKFYGLEIAVIDSINAIINRFGEDQHYPQRVFLIFDGIHYDPLYLEPLDVSKIFYIFLKYDIKSNIIFFFYYIFSIHIHRVAAFKQFFLPKMRKYYLKQLNLQKK